MKIWYFWRYSEFYGIFENFLELLTTFSKILYFWKYSEFYGIFENFLELNNIFEDFVFLKILRIWQYFFEKFSQFPLRFDRVGVHEDSTTDQAHKPLIFTQKSSKNHVILDGIHEISFRLQLPRATYVYLHKQKDRLLLNPKEKVRFMWYLNLIPYRGGGIWNWLGP